MKETPEQKLVRIRYHQPKPQDLFESPSSFMLVKWLEKEIDYLKEKIQLFVEHDIRKYSWETQKICYEVLLKSFKEMIDY